ncbi:MAG: phage holin family protein [Bacteroidota bacterium]
MISLAFLLQVFFFGVAVACAAYILPFVYLRNFGVAQVVALLVSLFNIAAVWLLGKAGIYFDLQSVNLAYFMLTTLSLMGADQLLRGFSIKKRWGALGLSLLVVVLNYFLVSLLSQVL